jgi:hypothetical protein
MRFICKQTKNAQINSIKLHLFIFRGDASLKYAFWTPFTSPYVYMCTRKAVVYRIHSRDFCKVEDELQARSQLWETSRYSHGPLMVRENTFCLYLCPFVRDRTLSVPGVCIGP